ncbi:MAG: N-acetyltransferase [Clostridiales bacterium 38-18]|nr:MAG: N-acetyltransferase [Clostridiales bacterium 38-18]
MEIRTMKPGDWNEVSKIYLEGIQTKLATFQSEIPSYELWDAGHLPFGRLVAVENQSILGWAALSAYSSRCVYSGVAELSVYVRANSKGKGVGTAILTRLVEVATENNIWTLQAGVIRENIPSRQLHIKCGFREVGYRERLGQMDNGNWHDVFLYERRQE